MEVSSFPARAMATMAVISLWARTSCSWCWSTGSGLAGETPFWLRADVKDAAALVNGLRATAGASADSTVIDEGSSIWAPLRVPAGVEKTTVVEALLRDCGTRAEPSSSGAILTIVCAPLCGTGQPPGISDTLPLRR